MGRTFANALMGAAGVGFIAAMAVGGGAPANAQEELGAAYAPWYDEETAASLDPRVGEFLRLAVGSFSSAQDVAERGLVGVVEVEFVRLWPDRTDGVWIYQESAFMGPTPDLVDPAAKDRPFFQRVHRVLPAGPALVRRTTYDLADRGAFVGAWRDPGAVPRDALGAQICAANVERYAEGHWVTSYDCPNDYFGSNRVIGHEMYLDNTLVSWVRGFDLDGELVFGDGPEVGGVILRRKQP